MGKFCQVLTELSAHNMIMAGYYRSVFHIFILAKIRNVYLDVSLTWSFVSRSLGTLI